MPNLSITPLDDPVTRTTLDVLEGAKVVLATRGWGRQMYLSRTSGAVCAMGAVYIASGVLDPISGEINQAGHGGSLSYGVYGLLSRALPAGRSSVVDWNDDYASSEAEVQDLFDRAIAIYREENSE